MEKKTCKYCENKIEEWESFLYILGDPWHSECHLLSLYEKITHNVFK